MSEEASSTMSNDQSSAPHKTSPPIESFCSSCGKAVAETDLFCGSCGASLAVSCPECGKGIRRNRPFCSFCGCNTERKSLELDADIETKRRGDVSSRIGNETGKQRTEITGPTLQTRSVRRKREKPQHHRSWLRSNCWKLAVVFLIPTAIGVGILGYTASDMYAYSNAKNLVEQGRYEEAASAFHEIENYRDASVLADAATYLLAESFLADGDTLRALDTFRTALAYSDARLRVIRLLAVILENEPMQFTQIPSGSFRMGSSSFISPLENAFPAHTVRITAFEMMTTEVTQEAWRAVMGYNSSVHQDESLLPVENVNWNQCQDFVLWMNEIDPLHIYRLPSEAEWEYACRAGSSSAYYWGSSINGDYVWYFGNAGAQTHPVGQKRPNAWGLYDMCGNVSEWCEDIYHFGYVQRSSTAEIEAPADGSAWLTQPIDVNGNDIETVYRVYRGGNCFGSPDDPEEFIDIHLGHLLSRSREMQRQDQRNRTVGFRLVRSDR
jgi:formylglycine-generating enzyme required for sulfatase activity